MSIGVLVPGDVDDLAGFADRAESLGYDSVWTGELWGRERWRRSRPASKQSFLLFSGI